MVYRAAALLGPLYLAALDATADLPNHHGEEHEIRTRLIVRADNAVTTLAVPLPIMMVRAPRIELGRPSF